MPNALGDVTNALTGGYDQQAANDLQAALAEIAAVNTPTSQELQLSPLAQYYSTGELSPAQMQAATVGNNAFANENLSSVPISDMQQALTQEQGIANAQGMTPQERAAIAQAEETANTNQAGEEGAIEQNFAQRGVPQSLIAAALENQDEGQNSQNLYEAALQAQGQAANQGITALANEQTGAQGLFGAEAGQANTVAAAQNALNQFNAANTQQANAANQAATMTANTYNTENAQNVANQNVKGQQTVQEQNQVEAPQEAASLALQKAGAEAGVNEAQANQATAAGQQTAGLFGGLLGGASQLGGQLGSAAMLSSAIAAADGGEIPRPEIPPINFLDGGDVPGRPKVAGNSPQNDVVPARLSPGEFVVPRTAMANPRVRQFLAKNVPTPRPPSAHPSDIASILKALGTLRMEQA